MTKTTRRVAALLGAGILLVPAAAVAKPGPKAEKPAKPVKQSTYVFKGEWHVGGTVTVLGGNSRVRKAGLVKTDVAFDVTAAKLKVADTNADGAVTVDDLVEGDKVVVQAKLPRGAKVEGTVVARKVVDQTHPVVAEEAAEAPVEPAPVVPAPTP